MLADPDNHWAYADLFTSRLAQGKIAEAEEALESVLLTAPKDAPYVLESLLDTVTRLASALGGEEAAQIQPVIDQIQAELDKRTQNRP